MPKLHDSIIVQQDVGGPFPVYKEIKLNLWDNGRVTWESLTDEIVNVKLDREIDRLLKE